MFAILAKVLLVGQRMRLPVAELFEADPDGWKARDSCTLDHDKTGIKVWVGNGFWFLGIWESPLGKFEFSFLEKLAVWPVVKTFLKRRKLAKKRAEAARVGKLGALIDKALNDQQSESAP